MIRDVSPAVKEGSAKGKRGRCQRSGVGVPGCIIGLWLCVWAFFLCHGLVSSARVLAILSDGFLERRGLTGREASMAPISSSSSPSCRVCRVR